MTCRQPANCANFSPRYLGSGHEKFGSPRVINEDRVEPNTGFGTHSHREFEIFSRVVNGELQQYVSDRFLPFSELLFNVYVI